MWPIKEKENILAKSYPPCKLYEMCRYGSLININPSEKEKHVQVWLTSKKASIHFLSCTPKLLELSEDNASIAEILYFA